VTRPLGDRRALVTGAGRGLGAAIAGELARAGASVVLVARTGAEIEEVAARLRAAGGRATAIPADVTDEAAVHELARRAADAFGPIEILVNGAGAGASAPLARIPLDEWNRLLAVNATSAFLTMRAFLPGMLAAGWGRIVNVASIAGLSGARYVAHYAASKHALIGLTRAAAAEVEGTGVAVHAVCPGYADTPMTERTIADVRARTGRSEADALAAVLASAGQRRLVSPAEVADAVTSLCTRATNGEIAVLAGLMQDFVQNQESGIPGVRSIPLIGELMTNRADLSAKTELVIFIRATVIRDPSLEGDFRNYRDQLPRDDYFRRPNPSRNAPPQMPGQDPRDK